MKNLLNLPEVTDVNRWIISRHKGKQGHRVPILDEEAIDWSKVRHMDEADDLFGYSYWLIRYTCSDGINRLCAVRWDDPAELAEDFTEWAAASCGMTYNEYIGKPWLD